VSAPLITNQAPTPRSFPKDPCLWLVLADQTVIQPTASGCVLLAWREGVQSRTRDCRSFNSMGLQFNAQVSACPETHEQTLFSGGWVNTWTGFRRGTVGSTGGGYAEGERDAQPTLPLKCGIIAWGGVWAWMC